MTAVWSSIQAPSASSDSTWRTASRCAAKKARADSTVSAVTYGRGHPSPVPTTPAAVVAVTTTDEVSPRSAEACRKRVVNGMTSGVISSERSSMRGSMVIGQSIVNAARAVAGSFISRS